MTFLRLVAALGVLALPAAGQDGTRTAIPDAAAVKDAEKQLRSLFKDDYARKSPADVQALGRKLLAQAADPTLELPVRYVMLRDARDFAAQTLDIDGAFKAIDALGVTFSVDRIGGKSAILAKAAPAAKTSDLALSVAVGYAQLMEECALVGQYDAGLALSSRAEALGRLSGDPQLVPRIQSAGRDLAYGQKESAAVKTARKTLEEKPDDPAACAALGRFLAVVQGQWEVGLQLLVKGNDAAMKTAAQAELANPAEPAAQASLGDAWWAAAEKERAAEAKRRIQIHAAVWYEKALPGVTGLVRVSIENKLKATGMVIFPPGAERKKSELVGGTGGGPAEDLGKAPSLLIGLRVTIVGNPSITKSAQAVLLTNGVRADGTVYGDPVPPVKEVVAKPGYAVGGLISSGTDGTARMRGFKLIFMRIAGTSLDPRDAYESPWIGDKGAGAEVKLAGDGSYVVGIHVRSATDLDAFGLVHLAR